MDNKDIFDSFDSDPCDCNGYKTGIRRECDTETSAEFTSVPDEFGNNSAETAEDGMPEYVNAPEQANSHSGGVSSKNGSETATDNSDVNGFFNAPGIIAPLGKNETTDPVDRSTDLSGLYDEPTDTYDTESASDNDCGCGDGCGCGSGKHGCGCGSDSETAEDYEITGSPEDETAATCDNQTTDARCRCALDDYEIISDVLGSEKQLVKLYSTALCESAEEPLRDIFKENLIEAAADQYSTFEYMQKRGMYPTEPAPEDKVTQAKQQFRPLCDNWQ